MKKNFLIIGIIGVVILGCLALAASYLAKGPKGGLEAAKAVIVVKAEDLQPEVAAEIKTQDIVVDKYEKPFFKVLAVRVTPFEMRATDVDGKVLWSPDPRNKTAYLTLETLDPFYGAIPLMSKIRLVEGRTLTLDGPTWAVFGKLTSLEINRIK